MRIPIRIFFFMGILQEISPIYILQFFSKRQFQNWPWYLNIYLIDRSNFWHISSTRKNCVLEEISNCFKTEDMSKFRKIVYGFKWNNSIFFNNNYRTSSVNVENIWAYWVILRKYQTSPAVIYLYMY